MSYSARSHVAPGDPGTSADQNQGMDNEAFLYDNLQTEIASYDAHRPSAAVGAASDEFASTTLNVAWTAIGGLASGTVNQLETGAVDKYDLATFPHWLAIQTDDNSDSVPLAAVGVRKAWAPGTGPWSVIARVSCLNLQTTNKNQTIGFSVSDDTTPTNYNKLCFGMANTGSMRFFYDNQVAGNLATYTPEIDHRSAYLALVRETAGGTTRAWCSWDGLGWKLIGSTATAVAVAYLWIGSEQEVPTVRPIYMVDFIRTFDTATLICGRGGNS